MAQYKGMEVADDLAGVIRHMAAVEEVHQSLHDLQTVWDNLSLLGEMSGTFVEITAVREAFAGLSARLLNQLAGEARRKATLVLQGQAQVAINILVRNLFERTADIGFLATDGDLRCYADAGPVEREALRPAVLERLREYRQKYSVYEDVLLIAPGGEVLARLQTDGPPVTRDPIVAQALASGAPCIERYAPFDLLPAQPALLLYACRMASGDGHRPSAVLVLAFRFDDECRRVFSGLLTDADWSVLAWLDAGGRVLASSDALQVPPGARLPLAGARDTSAARVLRFGGRLWLARTCAAQPYQGYAGPGWYGHAMVPIEHAFTDTATDPATDAATYPATDAATPAGESTSRSAAASRVTAGQAGTPSTLPLAMLEALSRSPIFSAGLREIPGAAEDIESALRRAVWNGNVALGSAPAGRDRAFSKTLLREIGRNGRRTRDVFTRAIAALRHTVVSATLADAAARSALAVDILDRNLYERVNDCRWWALTTEFRRALEATAAGADDTVALTALLQDIHRLYTVYANLVLFDRQGRVVAVSQPDAAAAPGQLLEADWVRRTFALADTQAHAVSAFEASPLYGGRPTLIYTAAVRGLADPRRVVGGIALVFDTEPQLRAMLDDTLPQDVSGQVLDGAFNLFVDAAGQPVAASTGAPAVDGTALSALLAGGVGSRVMPWQGGLAAVAVAGSAGYREYRNDGVRAVGVVPLLAAASHASALPVAAPAHPAPHPTAPRAAGDAPRLELASFLVAGQWYALPGTAVLASIAAQGILPLPGRSPHIRGSVLHGGRSLLVLDLAQLLGADPAGPAPRHIVIVRADDTSGGFGLQVDDLGDNPEIDPARLQTLTGGTLANSLVSQVVNAPGAQDGAMLQLLSLPGLVTAVFGVRRG